MAVWLDGAAGETPAVSWRFDTADGAAWVSRAHQCREVRAEGGSLKGVTAGADPFLTSPAFALAATPRQAVAFRARFAAAGKGELFWIPQGAKEPQQKWSVTFDWQGGDAWREYRVRPYWQGEGRIGAFRLDFPNGATGVAFELSEVRIVEEEAAGAHAGEPVWSGEALAVWRPTDGAEVRPEGDGRTVVARGTRPGGLSSPPLALKADEAFVVALELAAHEGEHWTLSWASDRVSGLQRQAFRVRPDGQMHTYNVDLGAAKGWEGTVLELGLAPAAPGGRARLRAVRVGDEPQGPADVRVEQARLEDALPRAGRAEPFLLRLSNGGGSDASGVTVSVRQAPAGVRVTSPQGWERLPAVPACGALTHRVTLFADRAVSGELVLALSGGGVAEQTFAVPVAFQADLGLAKASYVPVPRPVSNTCEVGALYYPGWQSIDKWARIWPVAPERKPLLGWYDEANPEVVDWQIKWSVENGISFWLVDWYWHKGHQHNDHWIKAFKRARYRPFLKWAVMWANHNAAGSHSEEDQREVARFWIENYFNMPEYYRIDGKPVVMLWSPQNMNRDLGGRDGCKRLLELTRRMAVEAGYAGVTFIAMKWPEASCDPAVVGELREMGFDMTSIYHYMHHGGKAENPRRFSFDLVAESNYAHWKGLHETGILPFLPNLSTGWDDRPWHGDKGVEIYGRTVGHFQRICADARRFADEAGVRRLVLAPLNEWGEGSYAEPCAEFGFGMYEAVREAFCVRPAGGWPQNFGPRDVGLGPYDLPNPQPDLTTDWTFADSPQGWVAMMGIQAYQAEKGLRFKTATRDPAIERGVAPFAARTVRQVVVRMRVPAGTPGGCQLFWSSGGTPTEATSLSLPLAADGQMRDYVFEVGSSRAWRGRVSRLRFDPCNVQGVDVGIERIRLVPSERVKGMEGGE